MSIRQTRGAISFLRAQYLAILIKGFTLAAASAGICVQAQAADPNTDTILENLDPSKGTLKEQRPSVEHAVANKTIVLSAGTEFDTGDDITVTINLNSADPKELYVKGVDGSVAGVVVGADKKTGALELNGSGRIGAIKGTGSLSVNYTTKLDENVVTSGAIGDQNTRFGDIEIGAHGGTLNAGDIYADSISVGESGSLSSSGNLNVTGRIDVEKDAKLSSSVIALEGGKNSVLYGGNGATIGTTSMSVSSGSRVYVKSGFDKRASVIATGTLSFSGGSEPSSLIAGRNGAIYVGNSYDSIGFSDVSNGLLGQDKGQAKSLAIIDTAVDLGTNGGILLDGDLEKDIDNSVVADIGKVTLRNGASMFLSSSGADASRSYVSAGGKSASYVLDDTSSLYIRDAGALGDVTGGSMFVNSETGNSSTNRDVSTGNIDVRQLVISGKVSTGNIKTDELDINPDTSLTSKAISSSDIVVGNDLANISITADSITTTGQFSIEGENISITAGRLIAPGLTVSGSAVINAGSALVDGKIFTPDAKFNVSGDMELSGDLSVADGADVTAGKLILNGHTLSVDPDWSVGPSVIYAGSLSGSGNVLDGNLVVGQNSAFYVGNTMSQSQFEQYAATNLSSNGTGSIAYFDVPVTVASGKGVLVDSSATTASTATADKLSVAPNSLLVLNVSGSSDSAAAVTFENASATVENNGTIEVAGKNLTAGNSINLFSSSAPGGSVTVSSSGVVKSASIYSLTYNNATGKYDVAISSDAASVLENSGLSSSSSENIIDYLSSNQLDAGSLLGIALNADSYRSSGNTFGSEGTAKLIGSFTRVPLLGGAAQDARMVTDVAHESVSDRLGFGTSSDSGKGLGIWVKPVYRHFKSEDLDAGIFSYGVNSSLAGAAIGFDGVVGGMRLGVALNAGSVNSHSTGDLAYTKGNYDYAGVSAYALCQAGNFEAMGDVFYGRLNGDVKQYTSIGELKGDSDLNVAGAEVKAKYIFKLAEGFSLSPFAGIRYDRINAESFDGKYGTERFKVKSMNIDMLEIPAGLQLSLSQKSGSWSVQENAQLFGEWRGGDDDVAVRSVISGAAFEESADLDNRLGYGLRLGVDATNGALAFGAGYGYYGSSDTGSHSLYAKVSYLF